MISVTPFMSEAPTGFMSPASSALKSCLVFHSRKRKVPRRKVLFVVEPCRRLRDRASFASIKSWDYRPTQKPGTAPAIQPGVGHLGHPKTGGLGLHVKNGPRLA